MAGPHPAGHPAFRASDLGVWPSRGKLTCEAGSGQVTGMDESDADLLAATARGDAEAFGRFYRRHEHRCSAT